MVLKLEENRKMSSGKRIRHINIRYFFITDQIKNGNVVIHYCPTQNMVADFHTKPLQGKLFHKFRDQILGLAPMDDVYIHEDHRSVLDKNSKLQTELKDEDSSINESEKVSYADIVKRKK